MAMKIKELRECPEYKNVIAEWMNREFGNAKSFHFYESIVNHSMVENQLPMTFAAVDDGKLLGCVGIWRGDMLSRQDLFPWLSALIVNPEDRNQGVGQALQEYIFQYCKEKGYQEIYLYTDLEGYYEKTGWTFYDYGYEYTGDLYRIYRHVL